MTMWQIRTTLPDRPGTLAELARRCGDAGVNILGMQVFPGLGAVTDELVLRCPDGWGAGEVASLVRAAGGEQVAVSECTEQALVDQPMRYVLAARALLERTATLPEVLARLLDARVPGPTDEPAGDVLDVPCGAHRVRVVRREPFTPTEHARAAALAALVEPVEPRDSRPVHVLGAESVRALVGEHLVGLARLTDRPEEPGVRELSLHVDPAWRRRGVGARLLADVVRVAEGRGVAELVVRTDTGDPAALPLVVAAGLRCRVRASGQGQEIRVTVARRSPVPAGERHPAPA